jgi:hypothetical protein
LAISVGNCPANSSPYRAGACEAAANRAGIACARAFGRRQVHKAPACAVGCAAELHIGRWIDFSIWIETASALERLCGARRGWAINAVELARREGTNFSIDPGVTMTHSCDCDVEYFNISIRTGDITKVYSVDPGERNLIAWDSAENCWDFFRDQ